MPGPHPRNRRNGTPPKRSPQNKPDNGASRSKADEKPGARVRYAVVGMGHIAQMAVLPAFKNAATNSELTALVSGDDVKLKELSRRYGVPHACRYDDYERLLRSGDVDAVYIATPNSMHRDFAVAAARAGVHVLCEKPLAVTERECQEICDACRESGVKLMTAYRLHFDAANLEAVKAAQSKKLGELKIFNSVFSMQVKDTQNIRLKRGLGGGPLYDIGIYCVNAARYLFRAQPEEVCAFAVASRDPRFGEVPETVSAVLRYPGERLATFSCSFGAADAGYYHLVGTKGDICVDPAYEYAEGLAYTITIDGKSREHQFPKKDQFGPELLYFSDCILNDREPEPSGEEGLADVRVIRAILRSAASGRSEALMPAGHLRHPTPAQRIDKPGIRKPRGVRVTSPGGDED